MCIFQLFIQLRRKEKNIPKERNKGRLEEEKEEEKYKKHREGKCVTVLKHYAMKTHGEVEV
jgi:hypothetical protein